MKDQETILHEFEQELNKAEDEMTEGYVRDGDAYSGCFPSETSYCNGIESMKERVMEIIKEKYILTPKA